jgi:hypothetical protein
LRKNLFANLVINDTERSRLNTERKLLKEKLDEEA